MNSNNYVTLSNYTGYFKTIPANNNIVTSIYYPTIPSAYEIIIKNDSNEQSPKENYGGRLGTKNKN